MKTMLTGRVEITTSEIKNTILEMALRSKDIINAAIDKLLAEKNLIPIRKQYSKDEKIGSFQTVLVDVKQEIGQVSKVGLPKKNRVQSKGWNRPNVGIGAFLKELFNDEIKKGRDIVPFGEVLETVNDPDMFPTMTKERLSIYLLNRRQFKEIHYPGRYQDIKLKGA